MQTWYTRRGGQTYGPFSLAELRRQVASGQLRPDDLVAPEGTSSWVAARTATSAHSTTG